MLYAPDRPLRKLFHCEFAETADTDRFKAGGSVASYSWSNAHIQWFFQTGKAAGQIYENPSDGGNLTLTIMAAMPPGRRVRMFARFMCPSGTDDQWQEMIFKLYGVRDAATEYKAEFQLDSNAGANRTTEYRNSGGTYSEFGSDILWMNRSGHFWNEIEMDVDFENGWYERCQLNGYEKLMGENYPIESGTPDTGIQSALEWQWEITAHNTGGNEYFLLDELGLYDLERGQ